MRSNAREIMTLISAAKMSMNFSISLKDSTKFVQESSWRVFKILMKNFSMRSAIAYIISFSHRQEQDIDRKSTTLQFNIADVSRSRERWVSSSSNRDNERMFKAEQLRSSSRYALEETLQSDRKKVEIWRMMRILKLNEWDRNKSNWVKWERE